MYPKRIVCLTEEPTEVLYALGEDSRIVGISGFTVRPLRARREKPKVSAFLSAKVDRIVALKPDLAIGFSDIQADIAQALIKRGVNEDPGQAWRIALFMQHTKPIVPPVELRSHPIEAGSAGAPP